MPLPDAECVELMAARSVGRIAYPTDDGPRILPVNHLVSGDSIIIRTLPDGHLARHAVGQICAYEVDDVDEFLETGWSVVAVGRVQPATDDDFARMRYGRLPRPWAEGPRSLFLRLPCTQLSGRRLIPHGA